MSKLPAAKLITYSDVTQTRKAWAKQLGMRVDSLNARIKKWGVERALTTPPRPIYRMITFNGVTLPLFKWAKRLGITRTTLVTRIDNWGIENALSAGEPKANEHHGMKNSIEYRVWSGMKQRCYNPNHDGYKNYGGRGIVMCDEWKNSFSAFYRDMGPRPSLEYEIDRIDNDGIYEPSNCRWMQVAFQRYNIRSNRKIEYNGETLVLSEWAKRSGIQHNTLAYRLDHGWGVENALMLPVPWPWNMPIRSRRVLFIS